MSRGEVKLRWFQFRLRTLLVLPLVVAFGCYWYLQHRKLIDARKKYDSAEYQCGMTASHADLCEASRNLCMAEAATPFANSERAWGRHLVRVATIREIAPDRLWGALQRKDEIRDRAREELDQIEAIWREAMDHFRDKRPGTPLPPGTFPQQDLDELLGDPSVSQDEETGE